MRYYPPAQGLSTQESSATKVLRPSLLSSAVGHLAGDVCKALQGAVMLVAVKGTLGTEPCSNCQADVGTGVCVHAHARACMMEKRGKQGGALWENSNHGLLSPLSLGS
jgi:hypothetical protein